jgi:hypothetical protein
VHRSMYMRMSRTISRLRLWSNHTFLSAARNLHIKRIIIISEKYHQKNIIRKMKSAFGVKGSVTKSVTWEMK